VLKERPARVMKATVAFYRVDSDTKKNVLFPKKKQKKMFYTKKKCFISPRGILVLFHQHVCFRLNHES